MTRAGAGTLVNLKCNGNIVTDTVKGQCATTKADLVDAVGNAGFIVTESSCSTSRSYDPATDM